jgi:hypothetical protein
LVVDVDAVAAVVVAGAALAEVQPADVAVEASPARDELGALAARAIDALAAFDEDWLCGSVTSNFEGRTGSSQTRLTASRDVANQPWGTAAACGARNVFRSGPQNLLGVSRRPRSELQPEPRGHRARL